MKTYKNNISAVEKRIREVYETQRIVEPCVCDCSAKYRKSKQLWEQKVEGLELKIKRLQIRLRVRTLDNGLKVRTDTYSRQSQR